MTASSPTGSSLVERLETAAGQRLLSLFFGLPSWAVLGIAVYLTPDARGYGTHQQLGLSTCTLMQLTGYPCPMCGMTTCFTHMAHLEPVGAVVAQPFGVVLFLTTLLFASIAAVELVSPRRRWQRLWAWVSPREAKVAVGLILGLTAGWAYKLWQLGHFSG